MRRINLTLSSTQKADPELINCWIHQLSEEYLVSTGDAGRWLFDDHPDTRKFVTDFLLSRGWRITHYTTPEVLGKVLSKGFVVEDPADLLTAWKLSRA